MKIYSILRTMLPLMLAVLAGAVLFWTSRGVQHSHDQLANLHSSIAYEREAIRVLQAEWSYLNNPERLDALVRKHFDMQVPNSKDMIQDIDVLPEHVAPVVPTRKPSIYRDAVLRPSSPKVKAAAHSAVSSPSNRSKAASISSPSSTQPENLPASSSQKDKSFFSLIDDIAQERRGDE